MIRKRLCELFEDTGLNITEFSDRVGITRQSASHYLNGDRKPDTETVKRICKAFNCSADYLLGLSDVRKVDADLASVVAYTGLSEKIVNDLHETGQRYLVIPYSEDVVFGGDRHGTDRS